MILKTNFGLFESGRFRQVLLYFESFIFVFSFSVTTDIMLDLVCKLAKPNVALCHQMPFATDQKGFAQSMEKVGCFFFLSHHKFGVVRIILASP